MIKSHEETLIDRREQYRLKKIKLALTSLPKPRKPYLRRAKPRKYPKLDKHEDDINSALLLADIDSLRPSQLVKRRQLELYSEYLRNLENASVNEMLCD